MGSFRGRSMPSHGKIHGNCHFFFHLEVSLYARLATFPLVKCHVLPAKEYFRSSTLSRSSVYYLKQMRLIPTPAQNEGLSAVMLPGVSAEDCFFANLLVDPSHPDCQILEATDLLLRERPVAKRRLLTPAVSHQTSLMGSVKLPLSKYLMCTKLRRTTLIHVLRQLFTTHSSNWPQIQLQQPNSRLPLRISSLSTTA